eukprot:11223795-Lingulodinium_polyedra.AAC.1
MAQFGEVATHPRAAFVGAAIGREGKFAKKVAPARLSCRDTALRRSPRALDRNLVVALMARGIQPT